MRTHETTKASEPKVGDEYLSPVGVHCFVSGFFDDAIVLNYVGGNYAFKCMCSRADFASYTKVAR